MNSIKKALFLGTILATGLAFAPPASAGHDAPKDHQHQADSSMHHEGVMGKGVVHSVDLENRKINLSHEPIPALKWPEMTMDMDVAEGVDLSALKPEQNIHFHIVLGEDKVYRITKIMTPETGQQCEPGMDCPMHEGMKHDDDHGDGHHGEHDTNHGDHSHH